MTSVTDLLERGRQRRPLIGAHRGASARAPENTLAAFRAALEDGAEMIELDVHLTRDGQLAVIHDEETQRTTGATGVVAQMEMKQLRGLDAGTHKGTAWAGETIPTLSDVFALVRGRRLVNVEVKGGLATVPVLAQCLADEDMSANAVVSSFDPQVVATVSALRPAVLTGLLLDRDVDEPVAAVRAVGASLLHLEHIRITAPLVARLHDAGMGVVAWTVNAPDEMRRLAALGVEAILSDDPRLLRETIGQS